MKKRTLCKHDWQIVERGTYSVIPSKPVSEYKIRRVYEDALGIEITGIYLFCLKCNASEIREEGSSLKGIVNDDLHTTRVERQKKEDDELGLTDKMKTPRDE